MAFTEVLKSIVDYGATPVLLAVIIGLVIWFVKKINQLGANIPDEQRRWNERQEQRLDKQDERIDKMLDEIKDIKINTVHVHGHVEEEGNRKCNLLVDTQLNCLLEKSKANRVSCFMYHNGGYTVTGRSFQKMSMLYEAVDGKTSSVMGAYQNIPRTMFPILMQKLSEQGYYDIDDIESIKEDAKTSYQAFKSRGAKSVYVGAIKDSQHNMLGFVLVEYVADKCEDKEALKELIKKKINRISAAFEVGSDAVRAKREEIKND